MFTELGETQHWNLGSQEKKVLRRNKWTAVSNAAEGSNEVKTLKYPLYVATWKPLVNLLSHFSKALPAESWLQ